MQHVPAHVPPQYYSDYVWALRHGDVTKVRDIVLALSAQGFTADQVIRDLIAPGQREIGQAWGVAQLSVAQEHQATVIAEEALALLLDPQQTHPVQDQGEVVLCAAQDEWHSIAGRMVAVVWRHLGWRVRLVVPSVPAGDVAELIGDSDLTLAGVTCAMPANIYGAWRMISALREHGCWVVVGGRGFGTGVRAEHCARRLGADSYAADAATAHRTLVHLRGLGVPGQRPGLDLGERGAEATALMRVRSGIVSDAVDVAQGLHPELLADGAAVRRARDDLSLLLRTAVAAMLVDDPHIMRQHWIWYRELLASSGADPGLGEGWVDALLRRLPTDAPHTRRVLADVQPR